MSKEVPASDLEKLGQKEKDIGKGIGAPKEADFGAGDDFVEKPDQEKDEGVL